MTGPVIQLSKKNEKTAYLVILFSRQSPFFEGQSKLQAEFDWRHMLSGELAGESVTK